MSNWHRSEFANRNGSTTACDVRAVSFAVPATNRPPAASRGRNATDCDCPLHAPLSRDTDRPRSRHVARFRGSVIARSLACVGAGTLVRQIGIRPLDSDRLEFPCPARQEDITRSWISLLSVSGPGDLTRVYNLGLIHRHRL